MSAAADTGPRPDTRQFDLLCLSVAVALLPHLVRLPLWLGPPLLLLVGLRCWLRRRGRFAVSSWLRVPLAGLLLLLVIVEYGNVFGRAPGAALACGLLALKLLETERIRDARVVVGFAAFVLMSALLFNQSLVMTLALCAALVVPLATLVLLQPSMAGRPRAIGTAFRTGGLLLLAGLPAALAAFVLTPRLSTPLWGSPGWDEQARIGLNESMQPGSMTDLLVDDTPAMRVYFDAAPPPPAEQYFRAIVLWDFDGATWTRGETRAYLRPEPVEDLRSVHTYQVVIEPSGRHWVPALDVPLDAPDQTRLSSDHTLASYAPIAQPREFRLRSAARYRLAPTLTSAERTRALAYPAAFNPRALALAATWRRQGLDEAAIVQTTLALFNAGFTYTLSPPLLGRDSIDEFLFDTRAGYCEHFSSAFVFLMRSAGIPARVVTGYQGGWWNPVGDYLLVRHSDAHAWAEVWLSGRGWVRVDPTAAVSPQRVQQGAAATNRGLDWFGGEFLRELRNQFDSVNRLWTTAVIQFNALRQSQMLGRFGFPDLAPEHLLGLLVGAIVVLLGAATYWTLRSGRRPRGDALDAGWNRLRERFARAGVAISPQQGPLDFGAAVRRRWPQPGEAFEQLLARYVALRYGGEPSPEQVRAFRREAGKLRVPSDV